MNKTLLRIGGVTDLLFVVFHLAMVQPIAEGLASVSPDMRATASILNIHVAFTLLIFAYLAIFQWQALLTTRVGNIVAVAISLFWFLRAINQVVFYGATADGITLIAVCLVVGLLHLIPALRTWRNMASQAQPQARRPMDNALG